MGVFATPVSVAYYFLRPGIYEYSYTGLVPKWADFKARYREQVKKYVTVSVSSDAGAFTLPGYSADVNLRPALVTAGVIAVCILLCPLGSLVGA